MAGFVGDWDALEELIIRVYKDKTALPGDEDEYRQRRRRLQRDYPRWRSGLEPYWRSASIAGEPARQDPFTYLLSGDSAGGFVDNWGAMQALPAAREAINGYLMAVIERGKN